MNETDVVETSQYLTFMLDDEVFALDVSQVREVLDLQPITKVPGTPPFMRGVINVRGSVVPVMDLRHKFGLAAAEKTQDTRIIVMEIDMDGETNVIGTLADSVNEVMDMEADKIEPPPKIGMRWRTEFIKGIGKREDQFIIILDINRVFSSDELALVEAAEKAAVAKEKSAGRKKGEALEEKAAASEEEQV